MKKHLVPILKFAIPLAIIAWLLTTMDEDQLRQLWQKQKNWPMLTAGCLLVMLAVCITFVRWYLLVRALRIPFRMSDAFRLGALGYLMNFVGVGSAGGDLFKAVFLAHEQPGHRPEAVATIAVDRLLGLWAVMVVASVAILLGGISHKSSVIQAVSHLTLLCTAIGTAIGALILVPRFRRGRLIRSLNRLPKIGPSIGRLVMAVQVYRSKLGTLAVAAVMSFGVHSLLTIALYLAAVAVFDQPPTLGEHFIIVPISLVVGALPFTPAGLGTFELAMAELYARVPAEAGGDGIVLALVYRLMTIVIAMIGVVYYWSCRQEVAEVLEEAEHEQMRIAATSRK